MNIELATLSVPGILAAMLSGMLLGAAWYSPLLFGKAWLKALNKTSEELSLAAPAMIGSAVACLISATALAIAVQAFGADSIFEGLALGALLGIGLVATALLSDNLFCDWGWQLYLIQAGYRVSYCLVMAMILAGFPW